MIETDSPLVVPPIVVRKQRGIPFVKGDPRTNRKGRPPGSLQLSGLLAQAIKAACARRNALKEPCACATGESREERWTRSCRTIDEHFARRAFLNDKVLIAFQNKRIPDLQHQTGTGQPVSVHVHYPHLAEPTVLVRQPLETNGH